MESIDTQIDTQIDPAVRIAELEARIFSLEDQLRVVNATNAAHITVINDYSDSAMAKFLKWLQDEHELRIRSYNAEVVAHINKTLEAVKKMEAFKAEARRAMEALAAYQDGYDGILYEHPYLNSRHIGTRELYNGSGASKTHYYKIVKTIDHREKDSLASGATEACKRDDQALRQGNQASTSEN